jgi:hypothetical protein
MLFWDFGPYGIIYMNMCVVMTVAMVMLLRYFGPDCVFTTSDFPGQFTSVYEI